MGEEVDNPFASPRAQEALAPEIPSEQSLPEDSLEHATRPAVWNTVFAANLCLPLVLSLVTFKHVVGALLGALVLYGLTYPLIMQNQPLRVRMVLGGWLLAILQGIGVLHVATGLFVVFLVCVPLQDVIWANRESQWFLEAVCFVVALIHGSMLLLVAFLLSPIMLWMTKAADAQRRMLHARRND